MTDGAKVDDLDVFRVVKAALLKFRSTADTAVLSADGQIARVKAWLEGEQLTYWQTQIRKRTDAVTRAKEAVRQKKLFKDAAGRTPSAFQEEKILRACIAALEHAEARLVSTKKALPLLEKEIEAYRSGVQGLGSILVVEIPKAVAALERMATTLDEYITLTSREAGGEAAATPLDVGTGAGEGVDRGGESAEDALPGAAPSAAEPSSSAPTQDAQNPEQKGSDHVAG